MISWAGAWKLGHTTYAGAEGGSSPKKLKIDVEAKEDDPRDPGKKA